MSKTSMNHILSYCTTTLGFCLHAMLNPFCSPLENIPEHLWISSSSKRKNSRLGPPKSAEGSVSQSLSC